MFTGVCWSALVNNDVVISTVVHLVDRNQLLVGEDLDCRHRTFFILFKKDTWIAQNGDFKSFNEQWDWGPDQALLTEQFEPIPDCGFGHLQLLGLIPDRDSWVVLNSGGDLGKKFFCQFFDTWATSFLSFNLTVTYNPVNGTFGYPQGLDNVAEGHLGMV